LSCCSNQQSAIAYTALHYTSPARRSMASDGKSKGVSEEDAPNDTSYGGGEGEQVPASDRGQKEGAKAGKAKDTGAKKVSGQKDDDDKKARAGNSTSSGMSGSGKNQ